MLLVARIEQHAATASSLGEDCTADELLSTARKIEALAPDIFYLPHEADRETSMKVR